MNDPGVKEERHQEPIPLVWIVRQVLVGGISLDIATALEELAKGRKTQGISTQLRGRLPLSFYERALILKFESIRWHNK